MAVLKVWQVNTMERSSSDDHVDTIIYKVDGTDEATSKTFRTTGAVTLERPESLPSDFIPYASIDAATAMSWVKGALGSDLVASIESSIDANIADLINPKTLTGRPFDYD